MDVVEKMKKFKWTRIQIKALKGSINKWRDIVIGIDVDRGPKNCLCCTEFYNGDCKNCPVCIMVEEKYCHGTPYYEKWCKLDNFDGRYRTVRGVQSLNAAREELSFLKKILKAGVEEKKK